MTTSNVRFVAKNGIDNNGHTITNLGTSGSSLELNGPNSVKLNTSSNTDVTLPTSGTLGLAPLRIAVIGDSISAPNTVREDIWVARLESALNQMGEHVKTYNIAVGGNTFYRANTQTIYGTNTAVQQCIADNPDLVLVMLGFNDSVNNVDNRTLVQTQNDALTLFSTIRNNLPNVKIVYISEVGYDNLNFTPSTLKNKGVIPIAMTLETSGILAAAYTPEILENSVTTSTQTLYSNWVSLDTYIKGLSQIDGAVSYYHWQAYRVGCGLIDGLHITTEGAYMICSNVISGLSSIGWMPSMLPKMVNQQAISVNDLFNLTLSPVGNGYVTKTDLYVDQVSMESGDFRKLNPDTWFYPYNTSIIRNSANISYDTFSVMRDTIVNAPPSAPVYISINGAAFSSANSTTGVNGYATVIMSGAVFGSAGTYTIRYKIGNAIYGPYTQIVTASVGVTQNSNFTGIISEIKSSLAANNINCSVGNYFTKTITGATTFTVSGVVATGYVSSFVFELTNAGLYAITWWPGIKWAAGITPSLTATGKDVLAFYTHDGGGTWNGLVIAKDIK